MESSIDNDTKEYLANDALRLVLSEGKWNSLDFPVSPQDQADKDAFLMQLRIDLRTWKQQRKPHEWQPATINLSEQVWQRGELYDSNSDVKLDIIRRKNFIGPLSFAGGLLTAAAVVVSGPEAGPETPKVYMRTICGKIVDFDDDNNGAQFFIHYLNQRGQLFGGPEQDQPTPLNSASEHDALIPRPRHLKAVPPLRER